VCSPSPYGMLSTRSNSPSPLSYSSTTTNLSGAQQ
jgi:hypothetical protein